MNSKDDLDFEKIKRPWKAFNNFFLPICNFSVSRKLILFFVLVGFVPFINGCGVQIGYPSPIIYVDGDTLFQSPKTVKNYDALWLNIAIISALYLIFRFLLKKVANQQKVSTGLNWMLGYITFQLAFSVLGMISRDSLLFTGPAFGMGPALYIPQVGPWLNEIMPFDFTLLLVCLFFVGYNCKDQGKVYSSAWYWYTLIPLAKGLPLWILLFIF